MTIKFKYPNGVKHLKTGHIVLEHVRLSFPNLFEPNSYKGQGDPKFSANFLMDLDDNKEQIEDVKKIITSTVKTKWAQTPKKLQMCFHPGEEKAYDGYENVMYVSAKNKKRPQIADQEGHSIVLEDDKVFAGCYVDAVVDFYARDDKYGQGVGCNLVAVIFNESGERFGGSNFDLSEITGKDIAKETAADVKEDIGDIFGEEAA